MRRSCALQADGMSKGFAVADSHQLQLAVTTRHGHCTLARHWTLRMQQSVAIARPTRRAVRNTSELAGQWALRPAQASARPMVSAWGSRSAGDSAPLSVPPLPVRK